MAKKLSATEALAAIKRTPYPLPKKAPLSRSELLGFVEMLEMMPMAPRRILATVRKHVTDHGADNGVCRLLAKRTSVGKLKCLLQVAPGGRAQHKPPVLLEMEAVLSRQQFAIVRQLWNGPATYDELRTNPSCFRDGVTDEAVKRALERLRGKLNENPEWRITLIVADAKRLASLTRPPDNTTDK